MSKPHEALLYEQLPENKVRCHLCAHKCLIAESRRGICQVRGNHSGKLYSLTYGKLIAAHVDPIEKKPLFHFYPGSSSFSIASPGCNFRCEWCQNWEISQEYGQESINGTAETPPEAVIASAKRSHCQSISYTYTEPTVFFEYSYDVSKFAHTAGLKNVYVTNGYMSQEMIDLYTPLLDAANVDIKAFTDEAYRKYIGAHLQPVLDACIALKQAGVWLEITTLLIPGVNDDETQLKGLVQFIAEKLGLETPWHVSRYFPHYKFNAPTTPLASIEKAIEIGQAAGLKYIYGGNFQGASDTICPQCHTVLIERYGMSVSRNRIKEDNTCPVCGYKLAGIGMSGK